MVGGETAEPELSCQTIYNIWSILMTFSAPQAQVIGVSQSLVAGYTRGAGSKCLTFSAGALDVAVEAGTGTQVVEALLFDQLQDLRCDLFTQLSEDTNKCFYPYCKFSYRSRGLYKSQNPSAAYRIGPDSRCSLGKDNMVFS